MSIKSWHVLTDDLAARLIDHDHIWVHLAFHIVLVVMPALLTVMLVWVIYRFVRYRLNASTQKESDTNTLRRRTAFYQIPNHIITFITRYSLKHQLLLGFVALLTIPITYASLEVPKRIINNITGTDALSEGGSTSFAAQVDLLLFLCGIYLFILILNGALKYFLNYYKGSISEYLIRCLRVFIFQNRKELEQRDANADLVPVIIQEVEPVCGFSGDSLTVPLLQGGTALTILVFMMMQNVALGAAALTLMPIQLLIIPRFQKRINQLVQQRVRLIRELSRNINLSENDNSSRAVAQTDNIFVKVQEIRLGIFKVKFMSKSVNNFIMNLTPFFFYVIGGYLVIEGDLSIGALVASLASYKELSSSIRELFRYYQSLQDARVRYSEIYSFVHQT